MQTITGSSAPSGSAPPVPPVVVTPDDVAARINRALRQGNGGGGGSGGSGGRGGAGPAAGAVPQQPVPINPDVKAIGNGPRPFSGDCAQAEDFISKVKQYLRLNRDVPGFDSPIKKVSYTLSYIQGPKVAAWANTMGVWVDRLQPHENIPAVWDQFLETFAQQFQDSGVEQQACNNLAKHAMKWPLINQYILDFEELARKAGYNQVNDEMVQMFLKGLLVSVLKEVLRAPFVWGYNDLKQHALESVKSQQAIQNLLGGRATLPMSFAPLARWPQPMHSQNQPFPRYNSTTVPPAFNNRPVPMDIDHARTWNNPGWDGRRQQQSLATSTSNLCFSCGRPGHFTQDCPGRVYVMGNVMNRPPQYVILVGSQGISRRIAGEGNCKDKDKQIGDDPSRPPTIWTLMRKTLLKSSNLCSPAE
jgi:hypothetical protein